MPTRGAALITAAVSVLIGTTTLTPAAAAASSNSEVVAYCQQIDEFGILEQLSLTRGECVNIFSGPASGQANNYLAGLCGYDGLLVAGPAEKGECITLLRGFT